MIDIAAIQWKWPGAQCVVRGGSLERWDGPGECPSRQALVAAQKGYAAVKSDLEREAQMARDLSTPLARALVRLVADVTKTDPADARALCVDAYTQEWSVEGS